LQHHRLEVVEGNVHLFGVAGPNHHIVDLLDAVLNAERRGELIPGDEPIAVAIENREGCPN
jgi:hypothetical protein|tara:strand:- start:412 stop:594 length:183 start_codon:yes stop_codon:yes gene_type:complete